MKTSRHPERRAALVSAARRVAGRRGVTNLSVREVAAEAKVSVGSVLYYFGSFDELVFACIDAVQEEFAERRGAVAHTIPDPVARIRSLIMAGIPDVISDELRIVYESVALVRDKPHFASLQRSIIERQVEIYRHAIELGVALGTFTPERDIVEVARNIVALEDSYDMYPLFGATVTPAECRTAVMAYASQALGAAIVPDASPGTAANA